MAEEMAAVFGEMDWDFEQRLVLDEIEAFPIPDGITISVGVEYPPPRLDPRFTPPVADVLREAAARQQQAIISQAHNAAAVLRDALRRMHIDAELGPDARDISPHTLLVAIGHQPNHVLESSLKELGMSTEPTPIGVGVTYSHNRALIPVEHRPMNNRP